MKKVILLSFLLVPFAVSAQPYEIEVENDWGAEETAVDKLTYTGGANQFAGGFAPGNAPYGGFGGGSCTAVKTPIVFLHGNGDEAKNWDYPPSTGVASVYDEFRAAGYNDCELFGLTWLSSSERGAPQLNYHKPAKAAMVRDFIQAVKSYTGKSQVDVIAHSMGVTVGIHGIDYGGLWGSVRKLIGIAGGLRGLSSCYWAGYANPAITTCGSQNVFDSNRSAPAPTIRSPARPLRITRAAATRRDSTHTPM